MLFRLIFLIQNSQIAETNFKKMKETFVANPVRRETLLVQGPCGP